jgi:hypothetical protein
LKQGSIGSGPTKSSRSNRGDTPLVETIQGLRDRIRDAVSIPIGASNLYRLLYAKVTIFSTDKADKTNFDTVEERIKSLDSKLPMPKDDVIDDPTGIEVLFTTTFVQC